MTLCLFLSFYLHSDDFIKALRPAELHSEANLLDQAKVSPSVHLSHGYREVIVLDALVSRIALHGHQAGDKDQVLTAEAEGLEAQHFVSLRGTYLLEMVSDEAEVVHWVLA